MGCQVWPESFPELAEGCALKSLVKCTDHWVGHLWANPRVPLNRLSGWPPRGGEAGVPGENQEICSRRMGIEAMLNPTYIHYLSIEDHSLFSVE